MPRNRSLKPTPPRALPIGTRITEAQHANVQNALATVEVATREIRMMLASRSVEATQVRLRHLLDSIAYAQEQLR
jgi:hypothetical protein